MPNLTQTNTENDALTTVKNQKLILKAKDLLTEIYDEYSYKLNLPIEKLPFYFCIFTQNLDLFLPEEYGWDEEERNSDPSIGVIFTEKFGEDFEDFEVKLNTQIILNSPFSNDNSMILKAYDFSEEEILAELRRWNGDEEVIFVRG